MKFQTLGVRTPTLKPGGLTRLATEVMAGKSIKELKSIMLTPDELALIPQLYSTLDADQPITALDNEKIYKTFDGKEYLGSDIKSITMLMYNKPRSAYTDFKSTTQLARRDCNGAVPLGLLGFKRYRKIPYDKWRNDALELSIEKVFEIDLLLGKTFASTYWDIEDNTIKWKPRYGLITLAVHGEMFRPNLIEVQFFREHGWGNYKGNIITSYGTTIIKASVGDNINKCVVDLYNACDTPMRLMLAQRWAWYTMHRSSDMICDFQNWDNVPKGVDLPSVTFGGYTPHVAEGNLGVFGL